MAKFSSAQIKEADDAINHLERVVIHQGMDAKSVEAIYNLRTLLKDTAVTGKGYHGVSPIEFANALSKWHERFGSSRMKAVNLVHIFSSCPTIAPFMEGGSTLSRVNRLARYLRSKEGQISGGLKIAVIENGRCGSRDFMVIKSTIE